MEALRNLSAEQTRAFEELKKSHEALEPEHSPASGAYEEALRPLAEREKVLESKRLERDSLERPAGELDGEIRPSAPPSEAADGRHREALPRSTRALPREQGDLFEGRPRPRRPGARGRRPAEAA